MKRKWFYLACAIAGAIIPYSQFVPWLAEHGPDAEGFVLELFSTRIGAFFGLDVIVSAIVLVPFILWEGRRSQMNSLWAPIAATCLVGVSCGLPLFLFMRERNSTAQKFAAEWAEAWNRRDVEAVLALFRDDIVFTSPTALAVTGLPMVRGKEALRAYWTTALARIGSIRFNVTRVLWDSVRRELAIIYVADIDGKTRTVSENLVFGDDGRVATAEVFHGIAGQS